MGKADFLKMDLKIVKKLVPYLLFLFIFLFFLHPFDGNPDFFHHVNTGRYVLENGSFPRGDVWTFTASGREWIAYAWGGGVALYLIFNLFGAVGISIFVALVAVLTFYLLYRYLKLIGISQKSAILALILVAAPIISRFPARPEIFTYPFLISFLLVGELSRKKSKLALLLPVLTLLWANIYGSSLLIGWFVLGAIFFKNLIVSKFRFKQSKLLLISIALSLLTSFVNPYGLKTVFYLFLIPGVASYEGEWAGIWRILTEAPVSYQMNMQYLILIFLVYFAVFLAAVLFSVKKLKENFPLVVLAGVIFVPFMAFRQVPIGIFLSLPLLAKLIDSLNKKSVYIFWVIGIAGCLLYSWINQPGITFSENTPAFHLVSFIKEKGLTGNAFNHQPIGAFLTYNLYPDVKVFFDTRDDLFLDTEALDDLRSIFDGQKSIMPILAKYKVDFVVGDLNDGLNYQDLFNDSNWQVVYLDDRYFVAIPKTFNERLKLTPFLHINPYTPTNAKAGRESQAKSEYEGIYMANPDSFANARRLILVLIANNDLVEAENIAKMLDVGTGHANVFLTIEKKLLLGQIATRQKDCSAARGYLKEVDSLSGHKLIFHPFTKLESIPKPLGDQFSFFCGNVTI